MKLTEDAVTVNINVSRYRFSLALVSLQERLLCDELRSGWQFVNKLMSVSVRYMIVAFAVD